MAFLLSATTIRRPSQIREENSTQFAQVRTLSGAVGRDHFGSNKRKWILEFQNVVKADYDTIKAIYDSYLSTENTKTWEITETNYTVSSTNVHLDLEIREFGIKGNTYLSDFVLILTEA